MGQLCHDQPQGVFAFSKAQNALHVIALLRSALSCCFCAASKELAFQFYL
jgi:hypothetical protein